MTFYGIDYLQNQASLNNYFKYFLSFGLLLFLIFAVTLYLRHRMETKYRDLSIIAFLLLLFILGVQYSDYTQNKSRTSQSSQMVNVVKELAKEYAVPTSEILVNSSQLTDGTIIKIQADYYRLSLSGDQNSFVLDQTHLIDPTITITK